VIFIGFGMVWFGYTTMFWGYSLVKGYNLSLKQIVSPANYYTGTWPPKLAGNTVIIPDGTAASEQTVTLAAYTGSAATTSGTSGSSGGGGGGSAGTAPTGISSSAAIQKAAALFGWGSGSQWACLTNVIAAESGGNPNADNSSSGAYGIAQALGHGASNTAGTGGRNEYGPVNGNWFGMSASDMQQANSGNAYYQAFWMMSYIKLTYRTPCGAWSHEQSYHWY
jgi:hypothetical protein